MTCLFGSYNYTLLSGGEEKESLLSNNAAFQLG